MLTSNLPHPQPTRRTPNTELRFPFAFTTTKMSLDSLPTETLRQIGEYITSLSTLNALSHANRRFHLIFDPLLYAQDARRARGQPASAGAVDGYVIPLLRLGEAVAAKHVRRIPRATCYPSATEKGRDSF